MKKEVKPPPQEVKKAKEALGKMKGKVEKEFPFWDPAKEVKEPIHLQIAMPAINNNYSIIQDGAMRHAVANSSLGDNLKVSFNFVGNDSLICRARDKLALQFLESDADWQLQLDDDIIFPYGLGPDLAKFYSNWQGEEIFNAFLNEGVFRMALSMNAIDEILRSGIKDEKKIVAGLYFWRGGRRNLHESASLLPVQEDGDMEVEFKLRADNYIESDKLATGFLLTHRSVYEKMMKEFPELEYHIPENNPEKSTFAFYTPNITDEERKLPNGSIQKYKFYRSEDYAFSWRAKQCGFNPCINMNLILGHMGTHIYSWFDRPPIQKLMFDTYINPMHELEREDYKDSK